MTDEPTADEIDAAILNLNPSQMAALEAFMPGMHPKRIEAVHHQLADQNLISQGLRTGSGGMSIARGDWMFTPLGRAVQARLKQT